MEKEDKSMIGLLPINELRAEQLHFYCEEECLDFFTTATVPPLQGMIGQERAVKAVEFGLHTKNLGYNIFISGMVGTGRMTYAKQVVQQLAKGQAVPQDWSMLIILRIAVALLLLACRQGPAVFFTKKCRN